MLQPVQKDHELLCPGCGAVLKTIEELPESRKIDMGSSSLSITQLGSTLENLKFHSRRDYYDQTFDKALNRLGKICQEFHLPLWIADDTMNRIKKKEKGLFSFREQIKQLLWVLDYNEIYSAKIKLIKVKYENVSGI